ncbi:TNF receptor-associated factor 4 [Irineochytrium annulatum]|nr:TNF receptor-associated factor 4 [Irineochytrium annulatum]
MLPSPTPAYTLITPANANLLCPICLSLLRDPLTLAPCGHTFCSSCLTAAFESTGRRCPLDRIRPTHPSVPCVVLRNLIRELDCRCCIGKKESEECGWTGSLADHRVHLSVAHGMEEEERRVDDRAAVTGADGVADAGNAASEAVPATTTSTTPDLDTPQVDMRECPYCGEELATDSELEAHSISPFLRLFDQQTQMIASLRDELTEFEDASVREREDLAIENDSLRRHVGLLTDELALRRGGADVAVPALLPPAETAISLQPGSLHLRSELDTVASELSSLRSLVTQQKESDTRRERAMEERILARVGSFAVAPAGGGSAEEDARSLRAEVKALREEMAGVVSFCKTLQAQLAFFLTKDGASGAKAGIAKRPGSAGVAGAPPANGATEVKRRTPSVTSATSDDEGGESPASHISSGRNKL